MPQFAFIAKDRLGNTVQGNVDAPDLAFAANQIGQMGYSLVDLAPAAATSSPAPLLEGEGSQSSPRASAQFGEGGAFAYGNAHPRDPSAPTSSPRPGAGGEAELPSSGTRGAGGEADDILQADAARRRKVEADLARMGMKPHEIQRLLDANANTTAPPPLNSDAYLAAGATPTAPAPRNAKLAAQQKLAARTADLQSFAAQLQSSSAAARVQAVEAVTLDLPEFRASTPKEAQQAEALLREVYALRRREKYTEALGKCREALDLVPADAAALEMFGDLLQGLARTNEAMAAYKRAAEADPKRASAERKYGDLLVRQQQWNEPDTEEVPKNPIAAAAFSLLIPGAGQIHTGQTLKGIVLLACAAISMGALIFLMRDKQAYETSPNLRPHAPVTAREKRVNIDWTAQAPVLACVGFYTLLSLGSAIDAANYARRARQQR